MDQLALVPYADLSARCWPGTRTDRSGGRDLIRSLESSTVSVLSAVSAGGAHTCQSCSKEGNVTMSEKSVEVVAAHRFCCRFAMHPTALGFPSDLFAK